MILLEIKNLHARINNQEILKGIDLTVNAGEVHSIMGPNGSGKSTLAQVLARRESFEITQGEILFNGKDLLAMKPEEAACEGLFMAFQYPVEVPGISNAYFLRAALNAVRKYRGHEELDAMDFLPLLKEKMPFSPNLADFEADPELEKMSKLFTVETIVNFVEWKLANPTVETSAPTEFPDTSKKE